MKTIQNRTSNTIVITVCMRALLLTAFLLFGLSNHVFAQSIELKGTVLDSLEEPMIGASIVLKHAADDKLEAFAIADKAGAFRLQSENEGDFILQITYIGYGTFERPLTLKKEEGPVDFGTIVLRQNVYSLDGVTVEETFIPIVIKKDTIEYNAAAFKTRPNATVEDLLKKLPGIDVEKDGTIKAQGEEVQNVLVDGKDFFDDDPKIATRNIPADVVDKVQVYDQDSDFTEFTGIDDGNEEKTINLAIKEGKNKGLFGHVKSAYGSEDFSSQLKDRYKLSTNLNRFTKNMQLSAVANFNNINEQAFSLMDYLKFTGGLDDLMSGGGLDFSEMPINLLDNAGNNDLYSGGLNFNYDFGKKTELRSNYFYNLSKNTTQFESIQGNVFNDGNFTTASNGVQSKDLGNHRLRLKLKHKFDDSQDLNAGFSGSLSNIESAEDYFSESFQNSAQLINNAAHRSTGSSQLADWKGDAQYRKKLKKPGRFFTSSLSVSGSHKNNDNQLKNTLQFYKNNELTDIDSLDQIQNQDSESLSYEAKLNYVEPLGKANYLNFAVSRQSASDDRLKTFSDRVSPTAYEQNDLLTSDFTRNYHQSIAGMGFKRIRDKSNLSIGLDYQLLELNNEDHINDQPFDKNFWGLLPKARYKYQFTKTSQISAAYNTRVQAPDLEQLQPVLDNTNLTDIYTGNPNLSAEYIHAFDLNYNLFDQFYFRSVFAGFNMQYTHDRITDRITVTEDLLRLREPVNSRDAWSMNLYYEYSSPVQGKNLKFRVGGNYNLQRENVLTNELLDLAYITTFTQRATIENKKKEKVDWQITASLSPNITRYKINEQENQNFFNYNLSSEVIWYFKKTWYLKVNLEREAYSSASFADATDLNFVDASLNKSFADRKFTLSLSGINLLNENQLIQRNSFGSQYREAIRNRLGRYFLVGLTYNIRSFGK